MQILQLLASENFITVNKDLIKALGLEEAVLIGELASEHQYWEQQGELQDGFFYSTIENIEEKTTLSAHKQRNILNKLKSLGIIEYKIRGIPAKRFIKINEEQLMQIFNNKLLKNLTTSSEEISQLDAQNFNGNNNINNNNINNNKKNIYTPPVKKSKPSKKKYGEYQNVLLADKEVEKLKEKYDNAEELIQYLDEYIERKGYKSKSHYLCILNWVVNAVKERKNKTDIFVPRSKEVSNKYYSTNNTEFDDLDRFYAN